MNTMRFCSVVLCVALVLDSKAQRVASFALPASSRHGSTASARNGVQEAWGRSQREPQQRGVALRMAGSNKFDISRPVFDLLALRTVRGDALVRYNALNQSEPIRISLYALLAFTFLAAPSLSESIGYDQMALPQSVLSVIAAVGSAGLFLRECRRRNNQLLRMEKELNTETLPVRLPTNVLADKRFTDAATLQQLRALSNPPRIIAICGTQDKLEEALQGLSVLSKRLLQATVYVVPISTVRGYDPFAGKAAQDTQWLADCYDTATWTQYFDDLTDDEATNASSFRWFGLNSNGRSFGSGQDEIPQWIQLLGQHLRPTSLLDESDASEIIDADNKSLLESQQRFYDALIQGNKELMEQVCSPSSSPQVSEVVEAGGRIDDWNACLADGARPQGMQVSGADSTIVSPTTAYTTNVEFPANAGIDSATLLAVQKWTRPDAEDGEWRLELHQTIPWSPDAKAQGTLRCDCRGCVALTRSPERRTFGGIIG